MAGNRRNSALPVLEAPPMRARSKSIVPPDGMAAALRHRRSTLRPQALHLGVPAGSSVPSEISGGRGLRGAHAPLANTYKMSPDEDKQFVSHQVEYMVKDVLEAHLRHVKYEATHCSKLAQDLCSMIKAKVKELEYSRYRLVTQVVIGQDSDQNIQIASRCLWNHATDNFAAATYRNNSLYAIAIVYALYLD